MQVQLYLNSILTFKLVKRFKFLIGDALTALEGNLEDPYNLFQSWDHTISACYWFHVTCDGDNRGDNRVNRV